MLIFDQLKKNDPHLRILALVILSGLGVLLAGLWWVQIVSSRDYQTDLETQSFRTVRIPAVRGKILDRDGHVLAENRPNYNISLYLEELRQPFSAAYNQDLARARAEFKAQMQAREKALGRSLSRQEKKAYILSPIQKAALQQEARYNVASNVVFQVSSRLQRPLVLVRTNFDRHCATRLALPYPILSNIDPTNLARFAEQARSPLGVDLEIQSTRVYPQQTLGAHLLGCVRSDDSSAEGEEAFFSYRLPDFRGALGIEYGFDKELRGAAGAKTVVVNNLGYRQTENIWTPAEPGQNVVLTIDLEVQRAAEHALQNAPLIPYFPPVRGAAVVMDVNTGDVLAMASSPTLNPNSSVQGFSKEELERLQSELLRAQRNRATQEKYFPGSIFKLVVGLAALEAGWDPERTYKVAANPADPSKGYIRVGGHPVRDTAPPGDYDFRRALKLSSNSYFINVGLGIGPERIVRLGQRFHLGERVGLHLNQETGGDFPTLKRISSRWGDRNTANLSIGQDPVFVTPLQVAVLISAIANGGKVLQPRLVDRIEPTNPLAGEQPVIFASGQVRDHLGVSRRSLDILYRAMLADTEDADGTGHHVRDHHPLPGLRIAAKTGTAQVQDESNRKIHQTTWFASFASIANTGGTVGGTYAVVVMVEDGKSGGETCSPVAGEIYAALQAREQRASNQTMARSN